MQFQVQFSVNRNVRAALFIGLMLFSSAVSASSAMPGHSFESLPVFEQNQGQFDSEADFLLVGDGFHFHVATEPHVDLFRRLEDTGRDSEARVERIRIPIRFSGLRGDSTPVGLDPTDEQRNYLIGSDSSRWHRGITSYHRVQYREFYPGVTLEYRVTDALPEYLFRLSPGADPSQIGFSFGEETQLRIDEAGRLQVSAGGAQFSQRAPTAWQIIKGERKSVDVSYRVSGNQAGFELGDVNPEYPLVIDPILDFSTYFGGTESDRPIGIHTDDAGNIYVVGTSSSAGLATPGAYEENNFVGRVESPIVANCSDCEDSGPSDQVQRVQMSSFAAAAIIVKYDPAGTQRLWTTYITPDQTNSFNFGVNSTAVSGTGEVAFGVTFAPPGWPLVNESQTHNPTSTNAYVGKLDAAGQNLVFGTYLRNGFWLRGLDVGPSGEVLAVGAVDPSNELPEINSIAGQTCEVEFPSSFTKAFATLFSAGGTILFSSCLGGGGERQFSSDRARAAAIDENGKLYILGRTNSPDFPLVNPIQSEIGENAQPAFIAAIDHTTMPATIDFSTFFGPLDPMSSTGSFAVIFPNHIAVDSDLNIVFSGLTSLLNYPIVNALQDRLATPRASYDLANSFIDVRAEDLFATKIDPSAKQVIFSTFLGGRSSEDSFAAMEIGSDDSIYLSLVTRSTDYPVSAPLQATLSGDSDLGISKLTPDGKLAWSTYLGGTDDRMIQAPGGIALNPLSDEVIVGAYTRADDFPMVNPLQPANAGGYDMAISIIDQSGDVDTDGDGVIDSADAFPNDASEWRDTDNDGQGDSVDPDIDGDGTPNASDAFPQDALWSVDNDGDGIGDASDLFPSDPTEAYDLDGDGVGDFSDDDVDGDGVSNGEDAFPDDPGFSSDLDRDGVPDPIDTDDDNDGLPDLIDPAPFDVSEPVLNFNGFNPANTALFKAPLPEGFSTPDGAVAWTADTGTFNSGPRALGTRLLEDNEVAEVQLVRDFDEGTLTFWYRVDSEQNSDILRFFLNGSELITVSGDSGWQQAQFPISAGESTLTWRYEKNGSGASGLDAAWIDDIAVQRTGDVAVSIDNSLETIPGGGQTTYLIPVNNLSATDADGVAINAPIPAQFSNASWTCESILGSAVCPSANGVGQIDEAIDLPSNSALLYRLTVDIQTAPEEEVTMSVTIDPGPSYTDEIASNNSSEDNDFIGIFGVSFE